MAAPIQIVLGILNWLHLASTVIWFGGLTTNVLVLMPSLRMTLDPPVIGSFMNTYMKKFRPLVYISMLVIVVTGATITAIINPSYLSLTSEWAVALLIKHVLVAFAIIASIYSFEVLAPKVAALGAKGPSPELARLQAIQLSAAKIAVIVAMLILLLTGIQTAL
ncbi:MAG: hypothetical protein ACFFDQ_02895 [Candidatus Thorarchaeota archaeon]